MNIIIREENIRDYHATEKVVRKAFLNEDSVMLKITSFLEK